MSTKGVFEERHKLKDLILTVLRDEPASISGIKKRLQQHGENLHRLIVTGYLRAMHDMGFLDETNLPPSKVYKIRSGHREKDLYDTAGRVVAALDLSRSQEARVLVALLAALFRRPIFKEELTRAAVEPLGLGDWEVETEARQSGRRLLTQAGFQLPHNNPAYHPPEAFAASDPQLAAAVEESLHELVRKGFQAHPYTLRHRQTTLGAVEDV